MEKQHGVLRLLRQFRTERISHETREGVAASNAAIGLRLHRLPQRRRLICRQCFHQLNKMAQYRRTIDTAATAYVTSERSVVFRNATNCNMTAAPSCGNYRFLSWR
jgi:hypothetical protein